MNKMTIALECALPREARPLFELPGEPPRLDCGIRWAWRELPEAHLVVAEAGMGTTNAAATAQFLRDRVSPAALIFYGIAGGLNPQLGVGDIVIGEHLCRLEADMDIIAESAPELTSFQSDAQLVSLAEQELAGQGFKRVDSVASLATAKPSACSTDAMGGPSILTGTGKSDSAEAPQGLPFGLDETHERRYSRATIATSDLFDSKEASLAAMRQVYLADCEEMEGAGAAQVAARSKLPFLALRCLSNICGEAYGDLDRAEERLNATACTAAEIALGVARRLAAL